MYVHSLLCELLNHILFTSFLLSNTYSTCQVLIMEIVSGSKNPLIPAVVLPSYYSPYHVTLRIGQLLYRVQPIIFQTDIPLSLFYDSVLFSSIFLVCPLPHFWTRHNCKCVRQKNALTDIMGRTTHTFWTLPSQKQIATYYECSCIVNHMYCIGRWKKKQETWTETNV